MAHKLPNMVRQTSTSIGATTIALTGAALKPYRSFSSALSGGDTTEVMVVSRVSGAWQAGVYSYTDGALTLVSFIDSSTGSPITFTSGLKDVYVSPLAQRATPLYNLALLGVVSDGIDKTELLNSIFEKYGAGEYYLPRAGDGNVLTTGTVNMPNGGYLTIADDAVWEAALISWEGSIGTVKDFTERTAEGAISFAFDTTDIAVDDWAYVFGCTNLGSADAGVDQLCWSDDLLPSLRVYAGQFVRARTITPTAMTVYGGARWPYEVTPGADSGTRTISQAWKVNFITGGIKGGTIKAWSGNSGSMAAFAKWARDIVIEGVHFDMYGHDRQHCVSFQKSFNCKATRCTVDRPIDGPGSATRNAFQAQSSQSIEFSHNFITGGYQGFDFTLMIDTTASPCFDCSATYNTVYTAVEGATSHPGSTDIRIDYNRFIDTDYGVRIRTPRSSANFNTLISSYGSSGGRGVQLQHGFLDGTTAIGNIIQGFTDGITVDLRSDGPPLPFTVTLTDNSLRNFTVGFRIFANIVVQDATTKAIIIRGGEVVANAGTSSNWTSFEAYSNGLTIEGVTFSGSTTFANDGVIILPANTSNVTIGTNYFRDTGDVPCVYGPGATAISDMTAFPNGEAEARWTIKEQKLLGASTGVQTVNMPTGVESYAPGNPLLWTGELGKMIGANATAASVILSTATTVAHLVEALNHLIHPFALSFRELVDFMPGTMPDGATLTRPGVGWALSNAGVFESNAIDVERFHYGANGDLVGFLNEPAKTNLIFNSQTLVGATCTPTRATVTTGAETAPTGAATASKLVEDTTPTNTHCIFLFPGTLTSGQTYSVSCFAKAAERSRIRFRMVNAFGAGSVFFDLTAGTYDHLSGGISASITAYPDDWYLCAATMETTSSVAGSAIIELVTTGTTNQYTGDGASGAYLWGAQFELGEPSSFISTTNAAVTRAADVLTVPVTNNGTYDIDLIRVSGVTTVPGVVIGAGTYVVPTDVSPLKKVAFR